MMTKQVRDIKPFKAILEARSRITEGLSSIKNSLNSPYYNKIIFSKYNNKK